MADRDERRTGLRLRRADGGAKAGERYYLTVPRRLAERLPPEGRYQPELTEEGILYRILNEEEAPSWAREASG